MMKLLSILALFAGAAFAQCGSGGTLVLNPVTGLLDCTGKAGGSQVSFLNQSLSSGVLVTFTDNLNTLVKQTVCQDHTTKAVTAFSYTNATVNTVTFTPVATQTVDCFVSTGGVGATGPAGPTGAAGSSGVNSGSNPQMAQYVGASSTTVGPVTVSGDATIANGGALTVTKINGNTPGNTCTNQFTRSISSSAVGSCASIVTADLPTATATRSVAITDLSPVIGDSGLILALNPANAIHLTRVFCAVQGTTNVVVNLDKRAEATIGTDTGNHLLGADLTAVAGGANTSTFLNGAGQCGGTGSCAIAAHAPVVLTFTSVSGTPTALNCSIDFTVD